MKENEHLGSVSYERCNEILATYPTYKVFWGTCRGCSETEEVRGESREVFTHPKGRVLLTFEERIAEHYKWAALISVSVLHGKKEIHLEGYSFLDLY